MFGHASYSTGQGAKDEIARTTMDLLVNSFFDPETNEGAAFEEQIGFHGGMGGYQTQPFLLYPSEFELGDEDLVGAASVHCLLKGWLKQLGNGGS